jgi:hypothetical protein
VAGKSTLSSALLAVNSEMFHGKLKHFGVIELGIEIFACPKAKLESF